MPNPSIAVALKDLFRKISALAYLGVISPSLLWFLLSELSPNWSINWLLIGSNLENGFREVQGGTEQVEKFFQPSAGIEPGTSKVFRCVATNCTKGTLFPTAFLVSNIRNFILHHILKFVKNWKCFCIFNNFFLLYIKKKFVHVLFLRVVWWWDFGVVEFKQTQQFFF